MAASLAVLPIIAASFGRVSLVALPANLLAVPAFPLVLLASRADGACRCRLGGPGARCRRGGLSAAAPSSCWSAAARMCPPRRCELERCAASKALLARGGRNRGLPVADCARPGRAVSDDQSALLCVRRWLWRRRCSRCWRSSGVGRALAGGRGGYGEGARRWSGRRDPHQDAGRPSHPRRRRAERDRSDAGAGTRAAGATRARFDLVVLTHGQDDHVTGLVSVLERYEVAAVLARPLPGRDGGLSSLARRGRGETLPVHESGRGRVGRPRRRRCGWRCWTAGTQLLEGTVDDLNNNSVVLRLVYGESQLPAHGRPRRRQAKRRCSWRGNLRATVLKVGITAPTARRRPPSSRLCTRGSR